MWRVVERLSSAIDPSRYVSKQVLSPTTLWSYCHHRFFAAAKLYRRQQKKKAKPAGARRLIPAPSLHTKPPTFVRHPGRLTVHERKHEEFKQVLSRLETKHFDWKSGETREATPPPRRAADSVNPFEAIPTFRKKSDCGPPPIAMKKRKRTVSISAVTFEGRTTGVGRVKSIKDQKKKLLNFRRPRWSAQLKTEKRDGDG